MRLLPVLACSLVLACDSAKPAADPPAEAKEAEATPKPAAPEARPEPEPLPPAPEGTVVIDRKYVHTCADPTSCPTLLQDAGAAHCAGLELGGLSWRLPTLAELESWKGNAELSGFDVFHWSGSAWEEDAAQLWILDPGSDAKTTAKPDRKPFTIRCVAEPKG
ncbi:MAG: hypothetical protein H6712_26465 [Myxococcales bacterium]|nr:hypothetical protein [Myxococcales bacterium]MCB9717420.1 hypothetical protein [Myxococcales bacterium]